MVMTFASFFSRQVSFSGGCFKGASGCPFQNLSSLSVGCIKPECSINSVVYIYDTKGSYKPAYGIREAGIEAENHYHGAPTVRSQIGNPQKSGDDPAR